MVKFSTVIGFAAAAGIGCYICMKLMEKKKLEEEQKAQNEFEEPSGEIIDAAPVTGKEKLRRASMFAVGAAKTGVEKFKEGIDDIVNNDMVTKGEETYTRTKTTVIGTKDKVTAFAKTTADSIKSRFVKENGETAAENPETAEIAVSAETSSPAEETASAEIPETADTLL